MAQILPRNIFISQKLHHFHFAPPRMHCVIDVILVNHRFATSTIHQNLPLSEVSKSKLSTASFHSSGVEITLECIKLDRTRVSPRLRV